MYTSNNSNSSGNSSSSSNSAVIVTVMIKLYNDKSDRGVNIDGVPN